MAAKWKRMFTCLDIQEVCLEAAILQRVRNSSLNEWVSAEDITGLKLPTEVVNHIVVVEERSARAEAVLRSTVDCAEVTMLA